MSETLLHAPQPSGPPHPEGAAVTLDELAGMPAQRLARLLLERAAEDPILLSRLYETVDPRQFRDDVARRKTEQRRAGQSRPGHPVIVGDSPAMRRVATLLRRFGRTNEPVLIAGESGTGKELLARAIHDGSARAHGPFVALNCAAIPSSLAASELFGFEKGAFTGAAARSLGQIECANGGTLFLDEIGDMPIDLQAHLLRFLQEGQIRRIGARETISLDVRIVSATNVRLPDAIAGGRFREDLFYRLNVLTLQAPPLRERPGDILPLATHFLRLAEQDFNCRTNGFSAEALAALHHYRWPGNVRELMSVVRRAVVVAEEPLITVAALGGLDDRVARASPAPTTSGLKPGSPEERCILLATLDRLGENITLTADALRVSRVTLYRMLRRHGIALKRGLAAAPAGRRRLYATGQGTAALSV